jgi:type IV pilus assembly protein PilV
MSIKEAIGTRFQEGSTLIEILVAVLILSVTLIAQAGVQVLGVRANANAHLRSEAAILVNDISERIRANVPAALAGTYGTLTYNGVNCAVPPADQCSDNSSAVASAACTATQVAQEDAFLWSCNAQTVIPGNTLSVVWDNANSTYALQVAWTTIDLTGNPQTQNVSAVIHP